MNNNLKIAVKYSLDLECVVKQAEYINDRCIKICSSVSSLVYLYTLIRIFTYMASMTTAIKILIYRFIITSREYDILDGIIMICCILIGEFIGILLFKRIKQLVHEFYVEVSSLTWEE